MFIGHFALGYAAKRWAPNLSLAVLFAAAVFADLLWPVLVALGIEHVRIAPGITASTPLEFISYPYSHSLLTLTLLRSALRLDRPPSRAARRPQAGSRLRTDARRIFVVMLALVVSHWVLDVVTHIPDMPLYPGGPKFGLGLWNSVPGTLVVETVMFAFGVWIYARATTARDAIGTWAFAGVTAFLFVGFVVNANGTPPPSVTALWMMALGLGALTLWLAWFADRTASRGSVRLQPDQGGHMATQAAPAATPRAAIWEDFIDIFYAPSAVFRRRENGNFFIPLAVITIVCGALFYLNSGALQPMFDAEFDREMAVARRQNPNLPPEAIEHMRGFASRIQMVMIFIFIPIAIFGVGVTTWLAGKLVDAKQTFRAALVVGAYAYAPRILDGVLQGLQGLFLDPAQLDGRFRLSLGVGRFLDPDTVSPLLLAVVGRLDLITIWITVLIAIGLCVTGRIPLGKAAIAAAIVWLVGGLPLIIPALR